MENPRATGKTMEKEKLGNLEQLLGTTQLELSSGSFSVQKAFQAEHSERIFTHFFKTKSCLTHVREGLATLCEALVSWE